ncbi:MAG TPA: Rieske (2Fe-2S) protein [Candidatus Eisenbacteria bacterium]|jgi:cytochrome b6-f complex iron-sulfur subunit
MAESGNGPGASGDRRGFLVWLTRGFLGLWAVGGGAAIAAYMRPPERHDTSSENVVRVGLLGDYRIGEARMVRHGVTPFFVIRLDETRVVALSAVCTHVRCILGFDREKKTIVCPCHDGRFDLAGNVLSGPPQRALPSYSVSVRAGEIFVRV